MNGMLRIKIRECDKFYISYDEPHADELYAKLTAIPHMTRLRRVHGVTGFDAAHKRCAELSTTDFFVTIDGDNQINPTFLNLVIDMPDSRNDIVLSWACRNMTNGLVYGNGGLKLWSRKFALNMRTHEQASGADALDFCWSPKYLQINDVYSECNISGSAHQAFRAGFREGVKMCLDHGVPIPSHQLAARANNRNIERMKIWTSVGEDVLYGRYAMYGAACGIDEILNNPEFDLTMLSEYRKLNQYVDFYVNGSRGRVLHTINRIHNQLNTLQLGYAHHLSADESALFKQMWTCPQRVPWTYKDITIRSEYER